MNKTSGVRLHATLFCARAEHIKIMSKRKL